MTQEIEQIQRELGLFMIDSMPVEWEKIWLYAEAEDGYCSFNYCFQESKTGLISKMDFFWKRYQNYPVTKRDFNHILSNHIFELYEAYQKEYGKDKIWTSFTYMIESSGQFNIDFSYEKIEEDMVTQRRNWEIKYFGQKLPYTNEKYPY